MRQWTLKIKERGRRRKGRAFQAQGMRCAKAQKQGAFGAKLNLAGVRGVEHSWQETALESQAEARSQKALSAILKTMNCILQAARSHRGLGLHFQNNLLAIV